MRNKQVVALIVIGKISIFYVQILCTAKETGNFNEADLAKERLTKSLRHIA